MNWKGYLAVLLLLFLSVGCSSDRENQRAPGFPQEVYPESQSPADAAPENQSQPPLTEKEQPPPPPLTSNYPPTEGANDLSQENHSSEAETIDPLDEMAKLSQSQPESAVEAAPFQLAPAAGSLDNSRPILPEESAPRSVSTPDLTEKQEPDEPAQPLAAPVEAGGDLAETSSQDEVPLSLPDSPEPLLGRAATAEVPGVREMAIEDRILELINQDRAADGLPLLAMEESMRFAAETRAQESLSSLSHTRPNGTPYHTAFEEAGFDYAGKTHGENLAMIVVVDEDFDQEAVSAALLAEWKRSEGNIRNQVSRDFQQSGVGVYIWSEGNTTYIGAVQLFAGP